MRAYLLPGVLFAAAMAVLLAFPNDWPALAAFAVCGATTLWWVIVAIYARAPLAPHLVAVLAPLVLPALMIWQSAQALAVSDTAGMGIALLFPIILGLLGIPAIGFMVLLMRLLLRPPPPAEN